MNHRISAVVSDLDGVVYRGETPVPGAVEALAAWAAKSVPYVFVTNNATKSAAAFADKLVRLGVAVEPSQVITSAEATGGYLGDHFERGVRTFVIGERVLFDSVAAAGARIVGSDDAAVVVLGFDYALDYDKLRIAVRAVRGGATLLVTNPDTITPSDRGYDPCVGAIMAAIQAAAPDARPIVVGKPSPLMIEQALKRLGSVRAETIMIGDQIMTDIAAGRAAGLRSYLVSTGVPPAGDAGAYTPIGSLLDIRI